MDRHENVLSSVIQEYVQSAVPVSSQTIAPEMNVSSATIRHILTNLEEDGYLTHPHVSAGRIPTHQGYRFYVNRLMKVKKVTWHEQQLFKREYENLKREAEVLIRHTSRIISIMTHLSGIAVFHIAKNLILDHFELVQIDPKKIMVILILKNDWVKEELIRLEEPFLLKDDFRNWLNNRFSNLALDQVKSQILSEIDNQGRQKLKLLQTIVELLNQSLIINDDEIWMSGTANLINQPEFKNEHWMEQVVRIFDQKEKLKTIFETQWSHPGLKVQIGPENPENEFQNFSLVHVPCHFHGQAVGAFGVLGPIRMNYDRVIGLIEHCTNLLEHFF